MSSLKNKVFLRLVLVLLCLGAVLSTVTGVKTSVHRSQDFQWSGAHLMAQHIDPWATELSGDPDHLIYGVQHVNYLPLLYLLMLPLGYVSLTTASLLWALCNVVFATGSALLASRFFALSREMTITAVCLMLMATPTRMNFGNGQQALFVLMMMSFGLLAARVTAPRAAIAGVAYCKYNFAPPIFLYLWMEEGIGAALISLLPATVGLFLAWMWLGFERGLAGLVWLAHAPLDVSKLTYYPRGGGTNLMDVLEPVLRVVGIPEARWDILTLSIAVVLTVAILYGARKGTSQWKVALLGMLTFCLFKHHTYDGTTLLFPACFALARWRERKAQIILGLLAYIWFGQRLLDVVHLSARLYVFGFLVLAVALVLLYRMREEPQATAA